MHESLHRFDVVIHSGKQHALVAERNASIGQALECLFHFDGELARVIYMHAHPKRMMFGQNRTKLGRDPLGQEDRNPRADADKFDVLYRAEP